MQFFGIFRMVFFKIGKSLLPFFFTFLSLFFVIPSLVNFIWDFKRLILPLDVFSSEFDFFLAKSRAMLAGVCSGIADYTGWDVTLIRLAFVLTTIFVVGTPILLYLIIWAIAD